MRIKLKKKKKPESTRIKSEKVFRKGVILCVINGKINSDVTM